MNLGLPDPNFTPLYSFYSSGHLWYRKGVNSCKKLTVLLSLSSPPPASQFTEAPPSTEGREDCFYQLPKDLGLCAIVVLPPLQHASLIIFLPAHSLFISSFERSLLSTSSPCPRQVWGMTLALRWGPFALMLQLYRVSFVFSPFLSCSCPVCFDELLSALILSQSLTTHLQVCNLLLIIHFMRHTG